MQNFQIRLFRIVSTSSRRVPTTLTTTGAAEAAGKAATSSSAKAHLLFVSKIPDNLKLRLGADENPATSSSAKTHQLLETKRTKDLKQQKTPQLPAEQDTSTFCQNPSVIFHETFLLDRHVLFIFNCEDIEIYWLLYISISLVFSISMFIKWS